MRTRTERITTIDNALNNPEGQKKIAWRGDDKYLDVITLHSDMLMFRMENSRTSRQQQAYIKQHGLPEDYFSDPESEEVQNAQQGILFKMAKSQPGFIEDLTERKQKDELIITRDGYIVNGNRRTSALREIGVTYFKCAVLPSDATAKDIYALEQELQISTDFRMDYDWVNELNNIREGLMNPIYGFTEKELSKNLRISPQALKSKLRTISLVDQFLVWKNQEGNYAYEKLDKLQQAFEDLEKGMKKFINDAKKQTIFRNEVFTIMDNPPGSGEGRLYDYIRYLIRDFDKVQNKLDYNKSNSEESEKVSTQQTTQNTDPLDDIIGLGDNTSSIEIPFDSGENSSNHSENIYEAISDADAEHRDKKDSQAIFSASKIALRKVTGHTVDQNTTKKEETIATLKRLIEVSKGLIQELEG